MILLMAGRDLARGRNRAESAERQNRQGAADGQQGLQDLHGGKDRRRVPRPQ